MPMPNSKWSRTIVHHIWKALLSRRSQTIPGATKTHECLKPASQASNQDPLRVYHPPHPPPALPLLLVANSDLCLWCSANDGIGVLFPSVLSSHEVEGSDEDFTVYRIFLSTYARVTLLHARARAFFSGDGVPCSGYNRVIAPLRLRPCFQHRCVLLKGT